MKKRIITGLLTSAVMVLNLGSDISAATAYAAGDKVHEHDVRALTAVNDIDYTESTAVTPNPYRGFYQHIQFDYKKWTAADGEKSSNCYRQKKKLQSLNDLASGEDDTAHDLIHLRLDLSDFAKGGDTNINSSTTDMEKALGELFDTLRANKQTAVVRFAYDPGYGGKKDREPASIDTILQHQAAVGAVMSRYPDVIASVECGIFGPWGEMHSSSRMTDANLKKVIDKWLEVLPDTITISVRQPEHYAIWRGCDIAKLNKDKPEKKDKAYRVGAFNDGYLGSYDDRGTFRNRDIEVEWLGNQAEHTLYGGEIVTWEASSHAPGMAPKNNVAYMEDEAYKTHTSYLNRGWNEAVTDPFRTTKYKGSDSVYKNSGVTEFDYLRNRLGYRYVVRGVRLTKTTTKYENFALEADIENVGFAEMVKDRKAVLIIKGNNDIETYDLDSLSKSLKESASNYDPCEWDTAKDLSLKVKPKDGHYVTTLSANVDLPDRFKNGTYKVYLKLVTPDAEKKGYGTYPIQFSNNGTNVYDNTLEANYLGSFTVEDESKITKADAIDNVKFAHSVSAANDMSLNYYVETKNLKGFDSVKLVVIKKKYSKSGDEYTKIVREITDKTVGNTGNNGEEEYRFAFTGISAYEIGDDVTAQIVATKGSEVYTSAPDVYSVKKYALTILENKNHTADLKKAMVDMLVYGTAAQKYFGYRLNSYIDSDLTADMRNLGSTGTPDLKKYDSVNKNNSAIAEFTGKSTKASDRTILRFYFKLKDGKSANDLNLRYSYRTCDGVAMSGSVNKQQLGYSAADNEYWADIDTIATKDFEADITVGIYDGNKLISDEIHYSISTYISTMLSKNDISDELRNAMISLGNYSLSAQTYFANRKK